MPQHKPFLPMFPEIERAHKMAYDQISRMPRPKSPMERAHKIAHDQISRMPRPKPLMERAHKMAYDQISRMPRPKPLMERAHKMAYDQISRIPRPKSPMEREIEHVHKMNHDRMSQHKSVLSMFPDMDRAEPPNLKPKLLPDCVPAAIRKNYIDAYETQGVSTNSSATMARRCLEGMLRDVSKTKGEENLYKLINAIKGKYGISSDMWKAMHTLREMGNIGAHMEKDVNETVIIKPEEAQKLLRLIKCLIEKWYIPPHEEKKIVAEVLEIDVKKKKED